MIAVNLNIGVQVMPSLSVQQEAAAEKNVEELLS